MSFVPIKNVFGFFSFCVLFQQIFGTDFHNYVWPCARIFSDYLCSNRSKFNNKSVLELGSGTGICGIVAAKLGCKVLLTDKDDKSLELAKENAEINNVDVEAIPLIWGDPHWNNSTGINPDIIISSDCFYNENDIEDILYTVWSILEAGKSFYYSYQVRYDTFTIDGYLPQFNLKKELEPFESSIDVEEKIEIYKISLKS